MHASPASSQPAMLARTFLLALGQDIGDFDLQHEVAPELSELLGTHDGLLTVQRRSTGAQRIYTAGSHSAWLAELLADVQAGRFGPV